MFGSLVTRLAMGRTTIQDGVNHDADIHLRIRRETVTGLGCLVGICLFYILYPVWGKFSFSRA
jgi:hypothetical protein